MNAVLEDLTVAIGTAALAALIVAAKCDLVAIARQIGYLVTITRGRTLDHLRSEGAWHRRAVGNGFQPGRGGGVMAGVTAAELQMALHALPINERDAIELAVFGRDTYRQVAAKLGEPEGLTIGWTRARHGCPKS